MNLSSPLAMSRQSPDTGLMNSFVLLMWPPSHRTDNASDPVIPVRSRFAAVRGDSWPSEKQPDNPNKVTKAMHTKEKRAALVFMSSLNFKHRLDFHRHAAGQRGHAHGAARAKAALPPEDVEE